MTSGKTKCAVKKQYILLPTNSISMGIVYGLNAAITVSEGWEDGLPINGEEAVSVTEY